MFFNEDSNFLRFISSYILVCSLPLVQVKLIHSTRDYLLLGES